MNWQTTVCSPVWVTFGHLADPSRLGDWLPEVTGPTAPGPTAPETFTLTVVLGADADVHGRADVGRVPAGAGRAVTAAGELTAFEPPWLVAYRLFIGRRAVTLRVTCSADAGNTDVQLHQGGSIRLAVDFGRLAHVLGQG
jgi:hypothetical protein